MKTRLLTMVAAMVLAGCASVGPNYHKPEFELPGKLSEQQGDVKLAGWWTAFGDPALTQLVDEALANNRDLAKAMARVDEARAGLKVAESDRMPTASVSFERSRSRTSGEIGQGEARTMNRYDAGIDVSYEVDLWGRVRRANEAARADLLASEANRDAVRLTLVSDVASHYFALRALDARLQLLQDTHKSREETYALQKRRFDAGLLSELELKQAEVERAGVAAQVPALESQRAAREHALAVLLGRSPKAIVEGQVARGNALDQLVAPPAIPAGLSSDLLARRPDLRAAEQNLIGANARIGQAKASYLPSLTLTGSLGSESSVLKDLFTGPTGVWSLAGKLVAPLIDSGRIQGQVDAADARTRQALAGYQGAVQNAFREVADALVEHRTAREQLEADRSRVAALRDTLQLAEKRYRAGYSSYLEVLDAQRGLLAAESDRIDAQRGQLAAAVDVYRALGGGW